MSNIAWNTNQDELALNLLAEQGISSIEIAPTKIWPSVAEAIMSDAKAYKRSMLERGFNLVAMQSLLFNNPEAKLFGSASQRLHLERCLHEVIELANLLEIPVLVFGSPKNRRKEHRSDEQAHEQAVDFFGKIANFAQSRGATIGLEANASVYDCDFIRTSVEAADLVQAVNSPAFGLHLDIGNMLLEREPLKEVLERFLPSAVHLHFSRENLLPPDLIWSSSLPSLRFDNLKTPPVCSIEMLTNQILPDDFPDAFNQAVQAAQSWMSIRKSRSF